MPVNPHVSASSCSWTSCEGLSATSDERTTNHIPVRVRRPAPPKKGGKCLINELPDELLLAVLSFLQPSALVAAGGVCKRWHGFQLDDSLWRALYTDSWRLPNAVPTKGAWKTAFSEAHSTWRRFTTAKPPTVVTHKAHKGTVTCIQYDAQRLLTGSDDGTMQVWDVNSMRKHVRLAGHGGPVWCLAFSRKTAVSGSYDKTVKIWDLDNGSCKGTLRGHNNWVSCIQFDSDKIVSGSWDGTVRVWGREDHLARGSLSVGDSVYSLKYHDNQMLCGTRQHDAKLWDLSTGQCTTSLPGHRGFVYSVQFSASEACTTSKDKTAKLWDLRTAQCVQTFTDHTGAVMCCQFDENKVVCGSYDHTIRVFDVRTGACLRTLIGHGEAVFALQYDASKIISGSADETINVWQL